MGIRGERVTLEREREITDPDTRAGTSGRARVLVTA
jgi:hypothetical protein